MNKAILILIVFLTNTLFVFAQENHIEFNVSIPTAGNSWIMSDNEFITSEIRTADGILNWTNPKESIRSFFYMDKAGVITLGLKLKAKALNSEIEVLFKGQSKILNQSSSNFTEQPIGTYNLEAGYHYIDIHGLKKAGDTFADIAAILVKTNAPESIRYVKDDFYFGRRGPSDHLNYQIPEGITNVEWFYSEIRIPKHQDVEGSYFMANGFAEGYFGIQVNSPTERRILFSIWSPYKTDNPDEVPEEDRIKLLKKGKDVITNTFGNEGSGGQSYKVFNWMTNVNYGFLVGAKPSNKGYTDYVAYFFDPETKVWNLIAQFRRPKTKTYLKRLYSFLENFIPDQGATARRGLYQNQWVYDGAWHEINQAIFTADNTARKEYRLDYSGGNESTGFYLKNCGLTNDNTPMGTLFQRKKLGKKPKIDFTLLE